MIPTRFMTFLLASSLRGSADGTSEITNNPPEDESVSVENERGHLRREEERTESCSEEIVSLKKNESEKFTRWMSRCVTCDVVFRFDSQYEAHCKNEHGLRYPYVCTYCGFSFVKKCNFTNHVAFFHKRACDFELHSDLAKRNEKFRCDDCGTECKGILAFERHALSEHRNAPMIKCRYCDEKFRKVRQRNDHQKDKHAIDVMLRCKFCKTNFDRSDIMQKHTVECVKRKAELGMKVANNEVKIEDVEWKKQCSLRKFCQVCYVNYPTFSAYREHCKKEHPRIRMYACEHCHKSYTSNVYLDRHLRGAHADKMVITTPVKKYSKMLPYVCDYCQEMCLGVKKFEKHGKARHPGHAMFHCGECKKGFTLKVSMDRHLKEKHGEDKIRCLHCSKCYYRMDHLRLHQEKCKQRNEGMNKEPTAADERHEYYCRYCRKIVSVKRKYAFSRHVKQHSKSDRCDICEKMFCRVKNPNGLNEHVKLRHPCRANIAALLQTIADGTKVKAEV